MNYIWPKVHTSSLVAIAENYTLRCDAKQANSDERTLLRRVTSKEFFYLSEFLPAPFVKGSQPSYVDVVTDESVPVVNTLSIQNLTLHPEQCRHITREDYELLLPERHVKPNDVLLTVDGGVSIGKPCLFTLDSAYTIDSHVVILRPTSLSPLALVYLLASHLGQMQFQRAESGASGQTTVTEADVRRFVFPRSILNKIDRLCLAAEEERQAIREERHMLNLREQAIWNNLQLMEDD